MRRHCLVTLGNRCAVTEAPVPLHKARIFGMSNEQVLCIIHLCSIFHGEEQEEWVLESAGGGDNMLPGFWLSEVHVLRSSLSDIRSLGRCALL